MNLQGNRPEISAGQLPCNINRYKLLHGYSFLSPRRGQSQHVFTTSYTQPPNHLLFRFPPAKHIKIDQLLPFFWSASFLEFKRSSTLSLRQPNCHIIGFPLLLTPQRSNKLTNIMGGEKGVFIDRYRKVVVPAFPTGKRMHEFSK